ncbi:hypothetical protein KIPE111705_08135 [Kibdelosporangium persicum]|uniref:Methyltransferase type 11 n=1 Tax=Kibdelosporangium persicum TaxID=2698649 RepID=A0ABX2F235_9PSEU|nr:hypothetical protein [Kibdelosporangium persicum]NRN65389.1 Methyltransferase type 11 [Kibdelosporangium persicum]
MEDDAVERATCALEECENPLPPPARDEQGRLKGGKPVRYCCKAHADEASRRKRALESVGVEEPLQLLRNLGGQTRDVMDAALRELAEIRRRWDELDAGAVAQSAKDKAETAEALLTVERARREADDAEKARREAAAAAAKDQQRRKAAEDAAESAVKEAEQAKKTAWEQVAEHERARGQAETRAAHAEQALRETLDQLEIVRRELRAVITERQETERQLGQALAAADLAEAGKTLAEAKIAGAEERARLAGQAASLAEQSAQRAHEDSRRAQQDTATARQAESTAKADAAKAQAAYSVVVQRLSSQDQEIQQLRRQLAEARERERLLLENVVVHGEQVEGG